MVLRVYILLLTGVLFSNSIVGQNSVEEEITPILVKDDIVFSAFFGVPNWGKFFLSNHFRNSRVNSGSSFGIPPLSLEMEYFFTDRISGTISGIYKSWGGSWKELVLDDFNGIMVETERDFSFEVSRIRILLGINYHYYDFGIENVDLYAGFALGANSINTSHNSDYQGWNPRDNNYFMEVDDDIEFPLAFRARAGMKYLLTDKVGLNLEVGIGGATLNMGINYKL